MGFAKITDYDSRSTGNGLLDTGSTPVYSIRCGRNELPSNKIRTVKVRIFYNKKGWDYILSNQGRYAEGFTFYTDKDAQLAELETKKVQYLESKMDYSRPETVLRIYDKAIHDRVFKTPVGFIYLKRMQDYLKAQESISDDQIAPIPLYQSFGTEVREGQNPARTRVQPTAKKEAKEKKTSGLAVSVALNLILSAAIIAMFAITLNAEQPNILNYEKVITNRYASWEEDLTAREQVIREKERELKIEAE